MKTNKILRICSLFLVVMLLGMSLVSCMRVKRDEAMAAVEGVLEALKTDDYEKAETFFHPELLKEMAEEGESIESAFLEIEETLEIDFSDGASIKKRTGFHTTTGTSGGRYDAGLIIAVGDKDVKCDISVVKDDAGFGLVTFRFDN